VTGDDVILLVNITVNPVTGNDVILSVNITVNPVTGNDVILSVNITVNPVTGNDVILSVNITNPVTGNDVISSPGPKVHVNYCHHLASVVCRLSSVNFSHFKLLLRNHLADWNRT
jgi:hypothetical protein